MKSNSVKLFVIIMITLVICSLASNIFATSIIIPGGNNEQTNSTDNTGDVVNNTTTNTVIPATTNNNISSYNNSTSTLPKTGDNDIYIISALLLVCGISAVYAYKKIRDYNM